MIKNYIDFINESKNPNLDRPLCYMFNDHFHENDLLFNSYARYNQIRQAFYNTDLSGLSDYFVIINIHADAPLGTAIIHKSLCDRFIGTDDFNIAFSIADYNKRKEFEDQPTDIDLTELKTSGKMKNWWSSDDGKKQLSLKTKWNLILSEDDNYCLGLIGSNDSWVTEEEFKTHTMPVENIQQGLDHLVEFHI